MENQLTGLSEGQIIASEVAVAEFDRFASAMDFELEPKGMDEEDRKNLATIRGRIERAIEHGHLVIDDKGQPVYTPQSGDTSPITFFEPTGVALMSMDAKKKGDDVAKMFTAMGQITKTAVPRFSKMAQRDLRVCIAIATLFLS